MADGFLVHRVRTHATSSRKAPGKSKTNGIRPRKEDLRFLVRPFTQPTPYPFCLLTDATGLDTDAPSASEPPTDAFAHLEKNQHQRLTLLSKSERLTDLSRLSDRAGADPYTVSRALRARAREERRKDRERELADEAVRERYGLDSGLKLVAVDEVGAEEEVKEAWNSKRRSHRAVEIPQDKESLASTLVETTKRKAIQAIFDDATAAAPSASSTRKMMAATLGVRKGGENQRRREDRSNGRALGIVAGYGSSSGDDEG